MGSYDHEKIAVEGKQKKCDSPPKYNPKGVTCRLFSNGAVPKYVERALLEAYAAGAREPRAILAIREAAHTSVEMALEKMRARALKAEAQVRELTIALSAAYDAGKSIK